MALTVIKEKEEGGEIKEDGEDGRGNRRDCRTTKKRVKRGGKSWREKERRSIVGRVCRIRRWGATKDIR